MASLKLVGLLLACIAISAPMAAQAITCGEVISKLRPCITYLQGGALGLCCNGVKGLNSAARTTADRQQTCECLKTAAASFSGIDGGRASGLPKTCGVNIPYKISQSTNCKNVK